MQRFISSSLELPVLDEEEAISRADLVFYGVDHSGPSFEARVFVNREDADADTPLEPKEGYVGSFTVFGHAGCYGDEGHCLPENRFRDEFDQRPPHPLEPWTKTVIGNEALKEAIEARDVTEVQLTVVTVAPELEDEGVPEEPLSFDSVRVVAYED